MYITS